MDFKNIKRITIFAGHYGSGKTNIAVNYAMNINNGKKTSIFDLDIVNPYFRTKDAKEALEKNNVKLISSPYANTNVDTPAIAAESYGVIHNKEENSVIDLGGDDRGALALGRFAPEILKENDYEMLLVINKYRYLTSNSKSTVEVMREIEEAAQIKFTGIVNNSNIGEETTAEHIKSSFDYAKEIEELTGLKVKMTTVRENLCEELNEIKNKMPIRLYVKQDWQ